MNKWIGVIGLTLTLFGGIWQLSSAWTTLTNIVANQQKQIDAITREQRYLHGTIHVPSQEK